MRVLAINDLSFVGKCSLSVALPVISACGVTCDVLPTALLSTHTGGFEGYTFRDLTEDFPAVLKHWKSLNLTFDFIYSGYLGSENQIDTVLYLKQEFLASDGKLIVDPVMGDDGKLYAGFTDTFAKKMKELCKAADYILPNHTEACLLTDTPYPSDGYTLAKKLQAICHNSIATGIEEDGEIAVYYAGEECKRYAAKTTQGFFCGAGDLFASAFVGALANGKTPQEALPLCLSFVTNAIERSAKEVEDKRFGLSFEKELLPFIKNLHGV